MPLRSGKSQTVISDNIKELYHANANRSKPRPRNQIIAIAMRKAGKSKPKTVLS